MSKAKKTMGKGVGALTEVPGGLRMDPKNVRRRERAAELREEREEAAKAMAKDMRDDSIPDYTEGIAKLVVTLAHTFTEACAALAEAERVFDQAVAARAKAKLALDAEISRMANEVG